jgi:hypothetical protein
LELAGLSSLQIAALHLSGADGANDVTGYVIQAVLHTLTQFSELLLLEVTFTAARKTPQQQQCRRWRPSAACNTSRA